MRKRFVLRAEELPMWLEGQRLMYASMSEGIDGHPVRLWYEIKAQMWVVEAHANQNVAIRTSNPKAAVNTFNGLV